MAISSEQMKSLRELCESYDENYEAEDYTHAEDARSSGSGKGENAIKGRIQDILDNSTSMEEDLQKLAAEHDAEFEAPDYTQEDDAYSSGWDSSANYTKGLVKIILSKT